MQGRRPQFNSCVGTIPWRWDRPFTPVSLPGVSPWTKEPGRLQSMGSPRGLKRGDMTEGLSTYMYIYIYTLCMRHTYIIPEFTHTHTYNTIVRRYAFAWHRGWGTTKRVCREGTFDIHSEGKPWRREWQTTPVFLPGEFHGERSLADCSPWGQKESHTTEQLTLTDLVILKEKYLSIAKVAKGGVSKIRGGRPLWDQYELGPEL